MKTNCHKLLIVFFATILSWGCDFGGIKTKRHNFEPSYFFKEKVIIKLVEAAQSDDITAVDNLVANGVNVNAVGKHDVTPLMLAMMKKSKVGFQRLLHHKANPNAQDENGRSTVMLAAMIKEEWWLHKALEAGGDPDLQNPKDPMKSSALFYAIKDGTRKNATVLLKSGVNPNKPNQRGEMPVLYAALFGKWDMVYLLLEEGADPRAKVPPHLGGEGNSIAFFMRSLDRDLADSRESGQGDWFDKVIGWLDKHEVLVESDSNE